MCADIMQTHANARKHTRKSTNTDTEIQSHTHKYNLTIKGPVNILYPSTVLKLLSWLFRTKLRSYPQMYILSVAPVHLSIRHCFGNGDHHRPEQKLAAIRTTPYIITYLFIRHEKWCMCLDIIIKNWSTERGQKIENVQTIFCFCKIFGGFLTSFLRLKL